MLLHLGVESFVIDTVKRDNPGPSEEVCREVLNRWLSAEPGTGEAERTWGSVLEALETSGHRQLAEQLRREQIGESSVSCIGCFFAPHSLKQPLVWCPLAVILHYILFVRTCCLNTLIRIYRSNYYLCHLIVSVPSSHQLLPSPPPLYCTNRDTLF